MAVNTLTLYLPGSGVGIQAYEGSQLHLILVSQGADTIPTAPGETVAGNPFPQYVDAAELAAALEAAGIGGDSGKVDVADVGAPGGVASLGPDGKLPTAQLPTISTETIADRGSIGEALFKAQDAEDARALIGSTGLTLAELDERYALRDQAPPPPPPVASTFDVDDVVYVTGHGDPLRTDGKFPGWGRHELELGITATYDWRHGARPGVPGPPWPAEYKGVGGYGWHNVWGEAIPVAGGMPAAHRGVRVQVDRPQVMHLSGSWASKMDPADLDVMDGGYWNGGPDGYTKTTDWVSTEPNPYWRTETIGHSFDCTPMTNADGSVKVDTSIAHWFYPAFFPRIPIAAGAHVAIVTRMRLISDDPSVDLEQARFLGRISGDAFTGANVSVGAGGKNPALVMPRHVLLGPEWRWVAIVTGTEAQIRAMPAMPFLVP